MFSFFFNYNFRVHVSFETSHQELTGWETSKNYEDTNLVIINQMCIFVYVVSILLQII